MKILPTEFTKNGFNFRQLKRERDIAIFEQSKPGYHHCWYEVVRIKKHDGYVVAGNRVDPAETYASHEKWGTDGFTYINLEDAESKFIEMSKI